MAEGYVIPPDRRAGALLDLWRHRGLLWSLTLREVQVRYRQAALGVAWALLQPLALMAVSTLVFHRFLRVDSGEVPYALFVITGLVPWTAFHGAVSAAVPSLVTSAHLVRKIWFPREALPLACVLAVGLDLLAGLALWVGFVLLHGYPLTAGLLWVVPLSLLLGIASAGLALLGAAVNVFYRDVKHALPLVLQVLFFATPVVYPLEAVSPAWRGWFLLNPVGAVVEGLRDAVLLDRAPALESLLPPTAVALLLLVGSYLAFKAAEGRFADVV